MFKYCVAIILAAVCIGRSISSSRDMTRPGEATSLSTEITTSMEKTGGNPCGNFEETHMIPNSSNFSDLCKTSETAWNLDAAHVTTETLESSITPEVTAEMEKPGANPYEHLEETHVVPNGLNVIDVSKTSGNDSQEVTQKDTRNDGYIPSMDIELASSRVCTVCECLKKIGHNVIDCSRRKLAEVFAEEDWPDNSWLQLTVHTLRLDFSNNQFKVIQQLREMPITELSFRNNSITSIDPNAFDKLKFLKYLDLSDNALTKISHVVFRNPLPLEKLILANNKIALIEGNAFSGIPQLKTLVLDNNLLYNLIGNTLEALQQLKNLQVLKLSKNKLIEITEHAFDNLTRLIELDLSDNQLIKIPSAVNLKYLNVDKNLITSLNNQSFSGLKYLERLDISYSPALKSIGANTFNGLTSLKYLTCSFNPKLSNIDPEAFRSNGEALNQTKNSYFPLSEFRFKSNNVSSISPSLLDWSALNVIDIQDNPFTCDDNRNIFWMIYYLIPIIDDETHELTQNIKCSGPVIHQGKSLVISPLTRSKVCTVCRCLDKNSPNAINCSRRNLTEDFAEEDWPGNSWLKSTIPTLRLDFSNNRFKVIQPLREMPITELSFRNNSITSVDSNAFDKLKFLKYLDLSDNALTKISHVMFRNPLSLEKLILANNKIALIEENAFSGIPQLKTLVLGNNLLVNLNGNTLEAMKQLKNLQVLKLSKNKLIEIAEHAFDDLTRLIELDLSDNQLIKVPSAANLKYLNVDQNLITSLNNQSFSGLKYLERLDMSYSPALKSIGANTFKELTSLKYLTCSFNPQMSYIHPEAFSQTKNSHFRLSEFHFKSNNVSSISPSLLAWSALDVIDIQDNPYICDNIDMKGMINNLIPIIVDKTPKLTQNITCGGPAEHRGKSLVSFLLPKRFLPVFPNLHAGLLVMSFFATLLVVGIGACMGVGKMRRRTMRQMFQEKAGRIVHYFRNPGDDDCHLREERSILDDKDYVLLED